MQPAFFIGRTPLVDTAVETLYPEGERTLRAPRVGELQLARNVTINLYPVLGMSRAVLLVVGAGILYGPVVIIG
mgnify:CR=1 FL=1